MEDPSEIFVGNEEKSDAEHLCNIHCPKLLRMLDNVFSVQWNTWIERYVGLPMNTDKTTGGKLEQGRCLRNIYIYNKKQLNFLDHILRNEWIEILKRTWNTECN